MFTVIVFCNTILFLLNVTGSRAGGIVDECPGRAVQSLRQEAVDAELSFVFYYASWNRKSVDAREIYDELARYYAGHAYFAAVDCWHLQCNCSGTHASIGAASFGTPHRWPTMMMYYGHGLVRTQYRGGDWTFEGLSDYMEDLLQPVQRVHSKPELRQLLARSDAVVLGLFPDLQASHCRRQFNRFTLAAVEWLQNDPDRNFRFAGVYGATVRDVLGSENETAQKTASATSPQVLLISRTGIEAFNYSDGDVQTAQRWDVHQLVFWVQTEWRRSFVHLYGNSNPGTLVLRLKHHGHVLAILASDDQLYNSIAHGAISGFDSVNGQFHECETFWNHATACTEYKQRMLQMQRHADSVPVPQLAASRQRCVVQEADMLNAARLGDYYVINSYLNQRFQQLASGSAEELYDDDYSAERLLVLQRYRACLRHTQYATHQELRIATAKHLKKSIDQQWTDSPATAWLPRQHNRTLALVLLDADKFPDYQAFHEARGEQLTRQHATAAAAFIVDPRREHIYTMQERFSYDTLMRFVRQYYDGQPIARHLSTSVYQATPSALNALHLHSYNRQMFLQTVQHPHYQFNATTVVVLFHSPECGFCGIFSHTLLQVMAFLNTKAIQFIRVNALSNDMPWELVMPFTPTLLVFPRSRFPESRQFPAQLPVNLRTVLGFILAQLEPTEQVKVVMDSCRQSVTAARQRRCLEFAKVLVAQHIGTNLKYWQIFVDERNFILDRLKQFKDLSLDVQRSFRL